jgi:hypothetical protein
MSYLRGPLTRKQIKRLTPARDVATSQAETAARPKAPSTATKGSRPVLPAGIEEAFLSDAPGTYHPNLVGEVSLHYTRASQGLDVWERHLILAPLDEGPSWDSATLHAPDDLDLDHDAPDEADFVAPPAGSVGKAKFRSYGKQIKTHVYQSRPKTLWRCKPLKLQSKPEETKAEFAARVQIASREKRDAAMTKLRDRYATKLRRMEERIRKAEARVEREESQYDQQKLQTGISVGATVLGAIFGSRAMGRATSAARGAGRVAREKEDVRRAEEELRRLEGQRDDLEAEVEDAVERLQSKLETSQPEIEEVVVRPRKSDIQVSALKVGWKPD